MTRREINFIRTRASLSFYENLSFARTAPAVRPVAALRAGTAPRIEARFPAGNASKRRATGGARPPRFFMSFFGLLALVAAMTIVITDCREKQSPEALIVPDEISLETVSAVLGKADAENSGLFDVAESEKEVRILYHLYVPEGRELQDYIGAEMTPKIRRLYGTFRTVDRVVFVVETARPAANNEWAPYCSFVMTRRVVQETDWSGLLDRDLFKVCREIGYSR